MLHECQKTSLVNDNDMTDTMDNTEHASVKLLLLQINAIIEISNRRLRVKKNLGEMLMLVPSFTYVLSDRRFLV